jgi:hypothetical protein
MIGFPPQDYVIRFGGVERTTATPNNSNLLSRSQHGSVLSLGVEYAVIFFPVKAWLLVLVGYLLG